MSLNIECGSFHAECINHPSDLYIYFDGGFMVWNWNVSEPTGIWFNGDMFLLAKWKFKSAADACSQLNAWTQEMLAVQ